MRGGGGAGRLPPARGRCRVRGVRAERDGRASPEGFRGILALLWTALAETHGLGLGERAVRDVLAVVVATYEFHGGFRLRTLAASS